MKEIGTDIFGCLGLQGNSRRETVYKIINWLTVAGLVVSLFVWDFMEPNNMENLFWYVLVGGVLTILNLISWWGIYKEEMRRKKRSRGWRIAELVLLYVMFALLFGLRIYFADSKDDLTWQYSFWIMLLFTGVIRVGHHKDKGIGNTW